MGTSPMEAVAMLLMAPIVIWLGVSAVQYPFGSKHSYSGYYGRVRPPGCIESIIAFVMGIHMILAGIYAGYFGVVGIVSWLS